MGRGGEGKGGRKGLKEWERKERGEKEEEKGRGIWTPNVRDRSTPLIEIFLQEIKNK
jgi:hypothetical protein